MPRPWDYTRRRRLMMQGTMWIVLAGTLGLAGLVDRHKNATYSTELGAHFQDGPIHFQVPARWVQTDDEPDDRRLLISVVEPTDDQTPPQRRLSLYLEKNVRTGSSPLRYLRSSGLQNEIFGDAAPTLDTGNTATIAGSPTVRVSGLQLVQGDDGQVQIQTDVVLCAVLPDGEAITIDLWRDGKPVSADLKLLDAVAASITIGNP